MSTAQSTTKEVWKPVTIEPFSTYYSVSNLGNIRREKPGTGTRPGRMLKQNMTMSYNAVTLYTPQLKKSFLTHHLVALAFLGHPPGAIGIGSSEYQVDHINANRRDNHIANLQWVTAKDNMRLAAERGGMPKGDQHYSRLRPELRPRGEKAYNARLTSDAVRQIRKMAQEQVPYSNIATLFHVTSATITQIVSYKSWKHIDPENAGRYIPKTKQEVSNLHLELRVRGEKHGNTKLTDEQVRSIRVLASQGVSFTAIAKQFPVSPTGVSRIVSRESWKHVK